MLTKRYNTPCARFQIQVKKDNTPVQLSFDGYDADQKRRFLDVTDYDIQRQLEASPDFNVYFFLEAFTWDSPVLQPEVKPVKVVEFKNGTEAREWLYKEKKVPLLELKNKDKMVEIAKGLGYEISFKNDLK